ncbi:MAG: orotidine-5'-phosphate decarboxylase [Candidatus Doudnabacteria bacterium]
MKGFYLAADVSMRKAASLLNRVGGQFAGVKVHMLTDPAAKERIQSLKGHGAKLIWTDIKAHDTPDTVAKRVEALVDAGADIITVHASGGIKMMRKAVEAGAGVYAVVFLTSLTDDEFARYYQPNAVENMIKDAMDAGVEGFICPPTKVAWMRDHLTRFHGRVDIVSPGTRFVGADADDQQQLETPGVTIANGADFLVIGRMVTDAKNPEKAMARLRDEIAKVQVAET